MKKECSQIGISLTIYFFAYGCLSWICFVILYFLLHTEEERMPAQVIGTIITSVTSIILGVISAIVTSKVTKRNQITENTEKLKELSKKIESQQEETFKHLDDKHRSITDKIDSQHKKVIEDIGRGGESTLTKQHEYIINLINGGFGGIKVRYQKEDSAYSKFKEEQRDLKNTLDNFLKDYTETIRRCSELSKENAILKDNYKRLLERKSRVTRLNRGPKKEIKVSRDKTGREIPY